MFKKIKKAYMIEKTVSMGVNSKRNASTGENRQTWGEIVYKIGYKWNNVFTEENSQDKE